MKNLFLYLFVGLFSLHSFVWGERIQSYHFDELLRLCSADTLLLVDVDNTLIQPSQYLGSTRWGWDYVTRLEKMGYPRAQAIQEEAALMKAILKRSQVQLVEPCIPSVIQQLQARGVLVLGLTNRLPDWGFITADELQYCCGIDLTKTPLKDVSFQVFSETDCRLIEGVLFVGEMGDKGAALKAFLRAVDYLPRRLVFVDDRERNLKAIEHAAWELGIPEVTTVHYRQGDDWYNNYDRELADVELRYFGKILPDEAAEKLLQAKSW